MSNDINLAYFLSSNEITERIERMQMANGLHRRSLYFVEEVIRENQLFLQIKTARAAVGGG
jgi:hypothetical protein